MDKQKIDEIRQQFGGPISENERQVLEDVKAFIEFALRNGLSFHSIVSIIGHDVNGLYRYGFDLTEAEKDAFVPKTCGYSKITEESVGEVEEPVESDRV